MRDQSLGLRYWGSIEARQYVFGWLLSGSAYKVEQISQEVSLSFESLFA